jgi:hypothetical protein
MKKLALFLVLTGCGADDAWESAKFLSKENTDSPTVTIPNPITALGD